MNEVVMHNFPFFNQVIIIIGIVLSFWHRQSNQCELMYNELELVSISDVFDHRVKKDYQELQVSRV